MERLLLVDRCTVRKGRDVSGDGTLDYDTGEFTPGTPSILYTNLPCNVNANAQTVAAQMVEGGTNFEERKVIVSLSKNVDVSNVDLEDEIVVTAVHVGGDQDLVGRVYVVEEVSAGTYTVLRKLECRVFEETPQDAGS